MSHIRKTIRESFYGQEVDEASVNNKPLAGEPFEIVDTDHYEMDRVVDLDTELQVGVKEEGSLIFLYLIHTDAYGQPIPKVVGEMTLKTHEVSPYPIANLIRINPEYQGKGYGKTLYEWIINNYGGLVSDSTLTKRGGKGSFHVWRSLQDDGYDIAVVRWSDVNDAKYWEPEKVKNIENWVKEGKGGFRLVISA